MQYLKKFSLLAHKRELEFNRDMRDLFRISILDIVPVAIDEQPIDTIPRNNACSSADIDRRYVCSYSPSDA